MTTMTSPPRAAWRTSDRSLRAILIDLSQRRTWNEISASMSRRDLLTLLKSWSDRAAPAREARSVGDLDRHLPDAARRTGRRRQGRAAPPRSDDPLLRAPAVRSAAAGFRPLVAHRAPAAKTPAPRASLFLKQGTS